MLEYLASKLKSDDIAQSQHHNKQDKIKMVTIIAEAGVNHNGNLDLARKLIDAAADTGADIVKFQTFKATALASKSAPKAEYQKETTGAGQSQLEMLKALELSDEDHHILVAHCKDRKIGFLSTPFDFQSLDLLVDVLDIPVLKVGSGDMSNAPLLHACARTGKPVILSTGMSTMADIEEALGVAAHGFLGGDNPGRDAFANAYASPEGKEVLAKKLTLLHCTTAYPTPPADINLKAMDVMRETFGLPIGFSDHSAGIYISIAAVARGAMMIEKHMTLDCTMDGPDHRASLEPDAFRAMVTGIRETEAALGTGIKEPTDIERKNMAVARKSLVAATDIEKGSVFTPGNLTSKRPGNGLAPVLYWNILGKPANRDYAADDLIQEDK